MPKTLPHLSIINFKQCHSQITEIHPFLYQADEVIVSAHHQLMKPEPEICELLLSRYRLIPNECVFIDDLEPNIIAAENAGINGIHFKSPDQLKESLQSFELNGEHIYNTH